MRKLLILALIIFGIFFLSTCENAISLIDEIETEVKIANDLFLVIKSVSPSDLGSNVNPGSEITVVFDRELDMNSVVPATMSIYDETTISEIGFQSAAYNKTTNTLTIEPTNAYFDDDDNFTIRISGFKGKDGSELQSDYIWSFKTGIAPAGSIVAVDNDGTAEAGFTSGALVDVSVVSFNDYATSYFVSETESELADPALINGADWKLVANSFPITIAGAEGTVPLYFVFKGTLPGPIIGYSNVKSYDIVLDTIAPIVYAGSDRISRLEITQTGSVTEPYVYSHAWTGDIGLTFGSPLSYRTTINSTDGARTATLTVTDKAGNTGSDNMVFTKDTKAPDPPVYSAGTASPTTNTTPEWAWTGESGVSKNFSVYYVSTLLYGDEKIDKRETYVEKLTSLSISPSIFISEKGDRVLIEMYVQERDEAGNWSEYSQQDKLVFNYLPYNTQKDVSTMPTFGWPAVEKAGYTLEFFDGKTWSFVWKGTEPSYTVEKEPLSPGIEYTWRVITHLEKDTISEAFTFTTAK